MFTETQVGQSQITVQPIKLNSAVAVAQPPSSQSTASQGRSDSVVADLPTQAVSSIATLEVRIEKEFQKAVLVVTGPQGNEQQYPSPEKLQERQEAYKSALKALESIDRNSTNTDTTTETSTSVTQGQDEPRANVETQQQTTSAPVEQSTYSAPEPRAATPAPQQSAPTTNSVNTTV